MSIAAGLREIVDRLNGHPFNMGMSLIQFDELSPYDLLLLVNKVIITLDAKHKVDMENEKIDATYQRMTEFISVLGYPSDYGQSFRDGFIKGDKRVLHPILYWLLINLSQLKERAYLARYLVDFGVPQEFMQDVGVAEMYGKFKELQSTFKATHSALQQQKATAVLPKDLRRDIQQLSVEKDQLVVKIKSFKNRTSGNPDFSALLEVTSKLRNEQEEEARLSEQYRQQKHQLEQAENFHQAASQRLQEMRQAREEAEENPGRMLEVIRSDVETTGARLQQMTSDHGILCQELDAAERQLSVPNIDEETLLDAEEKLSELQDEVDSMENSLKSQLQAQASLDSKNASGGLQVYRQQAQLVAKKHEALSKRVEAIEVERNSAAFELEQLEADYEQRTGHRYLHREEFKEYAATLRDKTNKFKLAKNEVQTLRSEVSILKRTEQLLNERLGNAVGQLRSVEEQYGVVGHDELESRLMEASEAKSIADSKKGTQMEEISALVTKINFLLREKKNELAPSIKILRAKREELAEAEGVYLTKRTEYEAVEADLSKDVMERRSVVNKLLEETESLRSRAEEIKLRTIATDALIDRAEREGKCLSGQARFSEEYPSLSSAYTARIGELEQGCHASRKQQADVQNSYDWRMHQKQLFQRLNRLLEMKLRSVESSSVEVEGPGHVEHLAQGVNRLVIEGN
ncbi:hypothetical protein FOL47_007120 [Perkinsus chesapeaki]|uniref:IFT81 calponin homology domain-containing protein n=1 Tax=Perkinsus chesapeaki TaxID=330153 RepID=A0A7J6MW79_PERCH|nr:hypothetical protein FOL47_007120 [Perkinsus chesapeaki]